MLRSYLLERQQDQIMKCWFPQFDFPNASPYRALFEVGEELRKSTCEWQDGRVVGFKYPLRDMKALELCRSALVGLAAAAKARRQAAPLRAKVNTPSNNGAL
jgi:hypothetical protein